MFFIERLQRSKSKGANVLVIQRSKSKGANVLVIQRPKSKGANMLAIQRSKKAVFFIERWSLNTQVSLYIRT